MKFRWNPPIGGEWSAGDPPPIWIYAVLFFLLLCLFAGGTIAMWPHGKPVASDDFVRTALVAPFLLWVAISSTIYTWMYSSLAFEVAVKNTARWHVLTRWQRKVRAGVAVLDSVVLTQVPDLAERMLKLEGDPPDNPGKVMRLDSVDEVEDALRERAMLERLLTPLTVRLARAARGDSFDIVIQCERAESSLQVQAAWEQLQLPGRPRIRWLGNDQDPGFADIWFEDDRHVPYAYGSSAPDRTPKYRLVLAWHLNEAGPDSQPHTSEAAVALLLGSPALMQEKPELKRQAWLLRQIVSDADEVDKALALLLGAEQVPRERIHHFWYSRLKGLAQHATLGAVRDNELKVEEHALDPAMGPQAPVARWVLQALAAKMAHFGQGAQLVALPRANGVALNIVVKDAPAANVPWKAEYEYNIFAWADLLVCMSLWAFVIMVSPDKTWGTFETVFTVAIVVAVLLIFAWRIYLGPRIYTDYVWLKYGSP